MKIVDCLNEREVATDVTTKNNVIREEIYKILVSYGLTYTQAKSLLLEMSQVMDEIASKKKMT